MADLNQRIQDLLARIPEAQRQAAASLLAQYGPRLFELAQEDLLQYLRRLLAGDITAVAELDSKLSNDEFVAKVKANTARWEAVANYNKVRDDLRQEILLRLAPVVASVLMALVGL
jgi:TRAP-type C4-dicarboxylate transport system substrate-binding protein